MSNMEAYDTEEFEQIEIEKELDHHLVNNKKHKICKKCNLLFNKAMVHRNVCRQCRRK